MRGDDLGPAAADLRPGVFGVFGPPRSGRTTALRTLASSAAEARPSRPMLFVGARSESVPTDGFWTAAVAGVEAGTTALEDLTAKVETGALGSLLLVVDDLTEIGGSPLERAVEGFLDVARGRDETVVLAGDTVIVRSSYGAIPTAIRQGRRGLLLVPDVATDGDVLGVVLPRSGDRFVRRRGLLAQGGETTLVHLAHPDVQPVD